MGLETFLSGKMFAPLAIKRTMLAVEVLKELIRQSGSLPNKDDLQVLAQRAYDTADAMLQEEERRYG